MGWPYEAATWNDVTGAIYMGVGTSMELVWVVVAAAICVIAIAAGAAHELHAYKKMDDDK